MRESHSKPRREFTCHCGREGNHSLNLIVIQWKTNKEVGAICHHHRVHTEHMEGGITRHLHLIDIPLYTETAFKFSRWVGKREGRPNWTAPSSVLSGVFGLFSYSMHLCHGLQQKALEACPHNSGRTQCPPLPPPGTLVMFLTAQEALMFLLHLGFPAVASWKWWHITLISATQEEQEVETILWYTWSPCLKAPKTTKQFIVPVVLSCVVWRTIPVEKE